MLQSLQLTHTLHGSHCGNEIDRQNVPNWGAVAVPRVSGSLFYFL